MGRIGLNLGRIDLSGRPLTTGAHKFRLAILGDFSGRANRGEFEIGEGLAKRKPINLDFDSFERVLSNFESQLRFALSAEGGVVEISPTSLDDLHPDALYDKLEIFEKLRDLRQRLQNPRTFQAAAAEVRAKTPVQIARAGDGRTRGSVVPVNATLSDFERLVGRPSLASTDSHGVDELVQQIVAPYVLQAASPDQDELVSAVDTALASVMRGVLHNSDFQGLECAWRTLDFLVRRVETSAQLQVIIYDVTAEELAADLSAVEDLTQSGLYQMLVERPQSDASQGPISALIGQYQFEMTPPHAELLGRIAKLAAAADAPFITSVGSDCIDRKPEDFHPLVTNAWQQLRALPEARYVALTVPRFLLRTPYGASTYAIESFEFEEFDLANGLRGMLWGNGAIIAGVLLAEHFNRHGASMNLGEILTLGGMPFYYFTDSDDEQIALPCTERQLSERKASQIMNLNLTPLLAIKGQDEVRLAGFRSLSGELLAGRWLAEAARKAARSKTAGNAPLVVRTAAAGSEKAASPVSTESAKVSEPPETSSDEVKAPAANTDIPAAQNAEDSELNQLLAQLTEGLEGEDASESGVDDGLEKLLADLK